MGTKSPESGGGGGGKEKRPALAGRQSRHLPQHKVQVRGWGDRARVDLVRRFLQFQSGVRNRCAFGYLVVDSFCIRLLRDGAPGAYAAGCRSVVTAAERARGGTRRTADQRARDGCAGQQTDTGTARRADGAAGHGALLPVRHARAAGQERHE